MSVVSKLIQIEAGAIYGPEVITHGMGVVPKLAIALGASSDLGTGILNNFHLGNGVIAFGATDGTRAWAVSARTKKSGTQYVDSHIHSDAVNKYIYYTQNTDGSYAGGARFNSWDTNTISLTYFNATAAPLFLLLIGGDSVNAYCGSEWIRISTGLRSYTGVADGKAVIAVHLGDATSTGRFDGSCAFGLGIATDSLNTACGALYAKDNLSNLGWSYNDDKLVTNVNELGTIISQGSFNGHTASGFDINYDIAAGVWHKLFYIHLGGIDLEAKLEYPNLNADTKTFDTPGMRPKIVLASSMGAAVTDGAGSGSVGYSVGLANPTSTNPDDDDRRMASVSFNAEDGSSDIMTFITNERLLSQESLAEASEDTNALVSQTGLYDHKFTLTRTEPKDFYLWYLAIGEDGGTLANQATTGISSNAGVVGNFIGKGGLAGQSASSGTVQHKTALPKLIIGASDSVGGISTQILTEIKSALSGASINLGVLTSQILFTTVTVAGSAANAGDVTLRPAFKQPLTGASLNTGEAMSIVKGGIRIEVDRIKQLTADLNLGLGDERGFNNILTNSPVIEHLHPDEKVKNLKVKYRKNNLENDVYLHEIERNSSTNGVDQTINLPFVYDHDTADMVLDYKRKRFAAAVKRMSLEVGQDASNVNRSDLATVDIPSLGVSSSWEVTGTNVTPAGSQNLSLVPYSATPYTYDSFISEGGTLPVDTGFDIPPDFSNTPPEPVSGISVNSGVRTTEAGDRVGFINVSWNPPDDGNYLDAEVSIKESGQQPTLYISKGTGFDNLSIDGLEANKTWDILVESKAPNGLKGVGQESTGHSTGFGTSAPDRPLVGPSVRRSGNTWVFTGSAPNSDHPIKNYDWEIDPPIGSNYFQNEKGLTAEHVQSGTTTGSCRARFRARNIYGQVSTLWSPWSTSLSAEKWQTGHYTAGSVTNDIVGNLNANKITTGTLTVDGNPGIEVTGNAGIDVTGSGNITFENGGDIHMHAGSSNFSFINFKLPLPSTTVKGVINLNTSNNEFFIKSQGGAGLVLRGEGGPCTVEATGSNWDLNLRAATNGDIVCYNSLKPSTPSQHTCGTSTRRWLWIYYDNANDIPFRNSFVITEPDMVYKDAERDSGLCIMSRTNHIEANDFEWEQVAFIDKEGYLHCRGVKEIDEFRKPDFPFRGNHEFQLEDTFMEEKRLLTEAKNDKKPNRN